MKTLFTIMLCATTLLLRISYPFTPKQMLILEMFVIGVPSFILTFQPNRALIRGNFIPQVLKKSIPCAMLMFINILIVVILHENTTTLSSGEFTSLCTILLTAIGFVNLVWVCWPLNWLRTICVTISAGLIACAITGFAKFFSISSFSFPVLTTAATLLLCSAMTVALIFYIKEWAKKRKEASPEKKKKMPETQAKKWWRKVSKEFDGENAIGVGGTLQVDALPKVTETSQEATESTTGDQISMFEDAPAKKQTQRKPSTARKTTVQKTTEEE